MATIVTHDRQQLHVTVVGRGKPVLMLHGLGMHGRQWLPFILPYLHRFRFYLPDLRGSGRSDHLYFDQADVFHCHMQDMQQLVEQLDLHDVMVVGYSLGASVALHWQKFGDFSRVRRYLHIDQSPCIRNHRQWKHGLFGEQQAPFFSELQAMLSILDAHPHRITIKDLPEDVQIDLTQRLFTLFGQLMGNQRLIDAVQQHPHWLPWLQPILPIKRLHALRHYLHAYLKTTHDYRRGFVNNITPVTVFAGAHSPIYPIEGQRAFARTIDADLHIFTRSGHLPMFTEPLAFTVKLGNFLKRR